jgi:hypothetical protein
VIAENVVALGFIAHLLGDYVIQSDWMAAEKTERWWPAVTHAVTYGLPFLLLTQHVGALAVIVGTHAVIDRYRLARHVCWAKNNLAPRRYNPPWSQCKVTGYPESKPPWMAVWLMIVADNTLHVTLNSLALLWAMS